VDDAARRASTPQVCLTGPTLRQMRNRAPKVVGARRAEREAARRACKALVESDRNASAADRGYATWQVRPRGEHRYTMRWMTCRAPVHYAVDDVVSTGTLCGG